MDARNVGDGVAIVGYSHRMPGGIRSDADFWRLLSEREVVREPISVRYGKGHIPIGEFSGPGRLASPYEGLIRDEDELLFDRAFFGMSHNELRQTEPQVRMLLNCAWEAIEHVGWDLHSLRNSPTGVFIGSQVPAVSNWRPQHGVTEYSVSGISLAMLANRVSYHFNLMGSSATYCTACSAGVTALHAAMNALSSGDCDQALVGAVTYLGSARMSSSFNLMGIISPDGTCHSFDTGANGYMRSEGSFVFAVKPLAAAERDGDPIYAVIESTAVNAAGTADGSAGLAPGRFISAPTRHAQVELMREASARARLSPRDFDYIEAHATGTAVGDRIEGNAIAEAFGDSGRADPLRVSSVKSNVGHMEAAAFHCALLKVVLMMRRRTFAPTSKSFQAPNPEIDFARCPMEVQTECEPFPEHPVVVGINSFGFGGANGHCVVREHRPLRPRFWSLPLAPEAGYMIPLSARTPKALVESAGRLRRLLDDQSVDLYALAGNLSRRRTHFAARASFVARSLPELTEALDAFVEEEAPIVSAEEGERRLAMVFAGQGTQWAGCGRALYEAHPVFRRAVDAIDDHWQAHARASLREACFSAPQDALDEVQLAQPAIFMIQCALVELFKTWGVYPDCVVGHSSGEVAAAYACGALSLADATRLVFHRATLQQRVAGSGRMLSIGLDRPGVEELLDELGIPFRLEDDRPAAVEVACENAPANTVICGREGDLRPVMEALERRSLQNRLIPGNIAFHSRAMDAIRDGASDALAFLDDRAFELDVPFVSSVTGRGGRAAGRRLLVVEHPPAGPLRSRDGDGDPRAPARRGTGAGASLGAPAHRRAMRGRRRIAARLHPDPDAGDRHAPRLPRGARRPLQGRRPDGLRSPVSAAGPHRPPAAGAPARRAEDRRQDARRRVLPLSERVRARAPGRSPDPGRPPFVRSAAIGTSLSVAGGAPRTSRADHAGRRLYRTGSAGSRRRARPYRNAGVPAALPDPEDAGAAADGLAAGPQFAGRIHPHRNDPTLRHRREVRAARPRAGAAHRARPRAGRAGTRV